MSAIPQQGPAPLTQEQIDQQLGRVRITPSHLAGLFGQGVTPEQQIQTLQSILDGHAQYVMRVSRLFQDKAIQDLRGEYDPRFSNVDELYREKVFGDFMGANPAYKDYRKFVEDAAAEIASLPEPPKTREELFQKVKEAAAGRIKTFKPDWSDGAAAPPPAAGVTQPTQGSPSPAAGGGQGGAPADTAPGGASIGTGGSPSPSESSIWD